MPLSLLHPVWLVLASPSIPEADAVELSWAQYQAIKSAQEVDPLENSAGPWVADRQVELRPAPGGWNLTVRWKLEAHRPGWIWRSILGPNAELRHLDLDGRAVPVVPLTEGATIAAWVEGSGTLEARAFVPGEPDAPIELELMEATRGTLRVDMADRVPVAHASADADRAPPLLDGGLLWSGAPSLTVELREPDQAPAPRETLAVAHAGVGLTVGDAELRGRAHLQWEIRHGSLERVRANVTDLGGDLTIEGPNVSTWTRTGDTIEVELSAPASGRVDLDLAWTEAIAAGDESSMAIPKIEPDAWRTESTLQIARDGEIEVVPQATGWTGIASSALPVWGQGLVEGTPAAAYQRGSAGDMGQLDLLRFVPVNGPPTVVDVATYTMATTQEGRVLMRAHYDLRNDRAGHLTVRPPEGLTIIGARVATETALPSRDETGAWRIPLKRSLETVEGLLSFPVEVILMGEVEAWDRREKRALPLPTLDAPIAASRVTLHLPPEYESRLDPGSHNVVDDFDESEGLAYGRGLGQAEAAAEADALFQQAVDGYLANDFESAQASLEQLEQQGIRNQNMARLQSNLDVITGEEDDDEESNADEGEVALKRRVKEQARVRALEQYTEQERLIEKAEQAAQAGDYDNAEQTYQAALDLGDELAKFEQKESVEQESVNARVAGRLASVSLQKKRKKSGLFRRGRKTKNKGEGSAALTTFGNETPRPSSDRNIAASERPKPEEPLPSPAKNDDISRFADADEPAEPVTPMLDPQAQAIDGKDLPPPTDNGIDLTIVDEPDQVLEFRELTPPDDLIPPAPPVSTSISAAPGRSRRRIMRRGRRSRGPGLFAKRKSSKSLGGDTSGGELSSADTTTPTAGKPPPSGNAMALPPPKVTASALAVVIPATGRAVRYEQLLIEANQTQTITIDARRRFRRR